VESDFARISEEEGPILLASLICDRVLQEKDEGISAIRLVDQITVGVTHGATSPPSSADLAQALIVAPFVCYVLLVFKGGRLGTSHVAQVVGHPPEGDSREFEKVPFVVSSLIEGTPPGQNIVMQLQLVLQKEGVYWFEVRLDGRRVRAIPLRVAFALVPLQTGADK